MNKLILLAVLLAFVLAAQAAQPDAALLASCAACHADDGGGNQALGAPRLAGQSPGYLARQLRAFRAGDRVDPSGQMQAVSRGLSDPDIDALVRALARL